VIDTYSFGRIVIDGEVFTDDVIVLPGRVESGWWRKEGHNLHPNDLSAVFDANPEVLVVGTGASGRMEVPRKTRDAVKVQGIELLAQETGDAVETFEELSKKRRAAGAFHLTC